MLSPTIDTVRLFLHILAASVWVGGQLVLVGVMPALRAAHPDSTKVLAQAYHRVAWPMFALVVLTGLWSLGDVDVGNTSTAYQITLFVKIMLAVLSGAAAAAHQVGQSTAAKAVGGAVGLLAALGALFVGFLLTTGA